MCCLLLCLFLYVFTSLIFTSLSLSLPYPLLFKPSPISLIRGSLLGCSPCSLIFFCLSLVGVICLLPFLFFSLRFNFHGILLRFLSLFVYVSLSPSLLPPYIYFHPFHSFVFISVFTFIWLLPSLIFSVRVLLF